MSTSEKKECGRTGLDITSVVQIVLIILKVTKLVDWSWWVILIPLWFCLALAIIAIIICTIVWVIKERNS